MSRPIGSECCDNTVTSTGAPDYGFVCDECEKVCEVIV